MKILVTGCAGFIGFHLSKRLCELGEIVIGIDNLNDYYDRNLKLDRLKLLNKYLNFELKEIDIINKDDLSNEFMFSNIDLVVNLAAQPGVRYSFNHPDSYIQTNIVGFSNVIELCREYKCKLIYASSSSVYGSDYNKSESDSIDSYTMNLYAATKICNEKIAEAYWSMHIQKSIGLRFFSVYGPLGRPDMLPYIVADGIRKHNKISVYNNGMMMRDYTYIDDIIDGIIILMYNDKIDGSQIYNIGRGEPVLINDVISIIESNFDKSVDKHVIMVGNDCEASVTEANIYKIKELGYNPKVSIKEGLEKFCDWYKEYYKV